MATFPSIERPGRYSPRPRGRVEPSSRRADASTFAGGSATAPDRRSSVFIGLAHLLLGDEDRLRDAVDEVPALEARGLQPIRCVLVD
jgi:hypothetical protein